jgi:hypothetical protein
MITSNEQSAGTAKKVPGGKILCHPCQDESGHARSIGLWM